MRAIAPAMLLATLLTACSSQHTQAPVTVPGKSLDRPPPVFTVHKGDSLWAIAWRYSLDIEDIARWNALDPPYVIYIGERLQLRQPPDRGGTGVQTAPLKKYKAPAASPARAQSRPTQPAARHSTAAAGKVLARGAPQWRWPVNGKPKVEYGKNRKSLNIPGTIGQPVYTAAAGTVVYTGSGLRGYGKLIIVQHNDNYLSAYGHNQRILVSEHDPVSASQKIATMGDSDAERPMLHFEIRHKGRPVAPGKLLPTL